MENHNHNKDNSLNFNFNSGDASSNLKISLPDWIVSLIKQPLITNYPDINEGILDGYPIDDEF